MATAKDFKETCMGIIPGLINRLYDLKASMEQSINRSLEKRAEIEKTFDDAIIRNHLLSLVDSAIKSNTVVRDRAQDSIIKILEKQNKMVNQVELMEINRTMDEIFDVVHECAKPQ